MTFRALTLALLFSLVSFAAPDVALAQPPARGQIEKPEPPPVDIEPPDVDERVHQGGVRFGSDYRLAAGDEVNEAVVISGNADIAGHVHGDVVVIMGGARVAGTAKIDGDFVVIGGNVTIEQGATVDRDLVVIGGALSAPPDFQPGGEPVVIGEASLGARMESFMTWVTRGLMWGRPIVPELVWMWWVIGFFFFFYLAVNLVADRPARACADVLAEKPLSTFLLGLLVLLLAGPVVFILFATLIGIIIVPFAICALALVGLVGKVGVARWIGRTIVSENPEADSRAAGTRSFVIGFVVLIIAYMIPVLGFIAWASVGVLALGAGMSAVIAYYQRENPPKPRRQAPISSEVPAVPFIPVDAPGSADQQFAQTVMEPPGAATPPPELTGFPFAPFRDRLAAFLLDVILVAITTAFLDLAHRGVGRFLTLLLLYHIVFWAWKGTTVGGIICQLRVVRTTGHRLSFADALVRGLSSIFSLAVFAIGALWILKDPERQSWHDKIAGTYVVKVPKNFPL